MNRRTATCVTNKHVASIKEGRTYKRWHFQCCPNCLEYSMFKTLDNKFAMCWGCFWNCGTQTFLPVLRSETCSVPSVLTIIKETLNCTLQEACDVLRMLRSSK